MPSIDRLTEVTTAEEVDAILVFDKDGAHPLPQNAESVPADALHVRFRPRYLTGDYEARHTKALRDVGLSAAYAEQLCAMVVHWDLTDSEGNPVPLTPEALTPFNVFVTSWIVKGCNEAAVPSKS